MSSTISMLKNTSFRSLLLGQTLLQLGFGLYIIGVVTLLYAKNQSILDASLFPLVRFSTSWLSGMLAPIVIQKVPLRRLIIITQILQALTLVSIALYLYHYQPYIPVLLLFVIATSFIEGLSIPSRNAMIPRIIEKQQLVRANSLLNTASQIAACLGFVAGGRIFVTLGPIYSLSISFILVFIGAISFFCIQDPSQEPSINSIGNWAVLRETWSFVYKHPIYRRLFALDSLEYIAASAWAGSIMLVFVKEVLSKNEDWWGYIQGAYLLGTVLGGVVALSINQWLRHKLKFAFVLGSMNLGILTILFSFSPEPLLSLTLAVLMGIPYQLRDIALQTLLQTNAHNRQLPQIFSVHSAVVSISILIGVVLMGIVTNYYGPQIAFLFSGALVLCSAWMAVALELPTEKQEKKPHDRPIATP